ncbi:SDR family oxidoreductase [Micromonospora aurantiaca]|uniref:SDR family oxidoreductase n=1 Tax=Micromonospora aurantiaca (nom. illeg.) TaxID=47850 RepID=A0A1C6S918_9ACTN|nr:MULTISPECIES: SDR family oxidoreductase [Micromonospora]ADL46718.1 short-chain dehydrogenase/reductase SDR [Micromonospora aurantiaca ATCC 27029]ADU10676.1 short-chain dehydrogenase/reductase SDR [Micromonospora sp. L5]AXH92678.1 SDR family oxidoreductase [Micromonospora aurantiaca]KAB1094646.1 SDR family oxidoreductase [Micromonospora aurantiaca]MBC9006952.1 SDR family oxidoreductase [Micromonospora aurantiaca]
MTSVTIVTGGGRGIGAATARRLAADGHDLVIGYRTDHTAAESVAADVRAAGRRAVTVAADTTDPDQVRRIFDAADRLGPLTGLVNNAGVTSPIGPFTDLRVDDLREVVDVNLIGYVLCAQQAARRLTRGGAIVNVSSVAATLGSPGEYVHYAAVKAATDTLTVGLAKELAPHGVRVNAVAPGIIRTTIHARSGVPDRPDTAAGRIPMGRAGEPEEVAGAIAYLLGPDASYTTGAVLRVGGGL